VRVDYRWPADSIWASSWQTNLFLILHNMAILAKVRLHYHERLSLEKIWRN